MGPPIALSQRAKHRKRRLQVVVWLCIAGISAALVINWSIDMNWFTQLVLCIAIVGLLISQLLLWRGKVQNAASAMLWTLAICITGLVAFNNGLLDKGVLCFPALLIFAALFSPEKEFWAMFGFLIAACVAVGVAQLQGWQQYIAVSVTHSTLYNVVIILTITGVSIRFQAYDLRRALQKLEIENEKQRIAEAKANYLAQYDSLTGLPNRALCEDRFNQQLQHVKRHGGQCALLFVDLDNFKTINDSLGHSFGDKALQVVAKSLQRCLRSTDTACRFGGDEFLVLITNITHPKHVERVAKKILRLLAKPVQLDNHYIQTSASIGIVLAPQDGKDFDSYCKNADIAMYRAKSDGKNLYRFFDAGMNTLSNERFALIKDLRKAVRKDELRLHYQPKIDLHSGQLVGAEALVRWQHPERGLLSPADFIELAEETGLIIDIGKWVLKEACRQCKAWHELGHTHIEVAINLSPVQFSRGSLEKDVTSALAAANLDGNFLELELTESLLLSDADKIRKQLASLRQHGVSFSIDDFGTGYSNLGYLSKFELESLKIDQSFVRNMLNSKQDLNIIIAIINIANSLGLTTIAEGIEDPMELAKLTSIGCSLGQGYYWSRPLPATEFSALFNRFTH